MSGSKTNLSIGKRGKVYVDGVLAGIIEEREGLFIFTYDQFYLKNSDSKPVSLTIPLRPESYEQKTI